MSPTNPFQLFRISFGRCSALLSILTSQHVSVSVKVSSSSWTPLHIGCRWRGGLFERWFHQLWRWPVRRCSWLTNHSFYMLPMPPAVQPVHWTTSSYTSSYPCGKSESWWQSTEGPSSLERALHLTSGSDGRVRSISAGSKYLLLKR